MRLHRHTAFTLVEIMIVVSIIALLATIALPSFLRARQRAQNTRFINALRVARNAFELYAVEHKGSYPADAVRGVLPPEMVGYFGPSFDFTAATPIGGNWDWDFNQFGFVAGVSVVGPDADAAQLLAIDTQIDDGNISTGGWRQTQATRYTAILE